MSKNQKGTRHRYPEHRTSSPRLWTDERLSKMRDLASQGLTSEETAAIMGITKATATAAAKRYGISFHGPKASYMRAHAGNRFAMARMNTGLSLLAVEGDTGICVATLRRYESGAIPRRMKNVRKLAKEYGVKESWLLSIEG